MATNNAGQMGQDVNMHKRMAMGETLMAKGGIAKKMRKGGCA